MASPAPGAPGGRGRAPLRGLNLWQPYVVTGRLLYTDDQWLYLKQHVRHEGPLRATGLFKVGMREGRDVLSPREVVRMVGYTAPTAEAPIEVVEWERVNVVLVAEKKAEAGAAVAL